PRDERSLRLYQFRHTSTSWRRRLRTRCRPRGTMGEQCELRRIERTMEASIQRRALAQSRSGLYSCDVTQTEPSLPDRYTRLRAALANRYRLDRELGRGGMAKVYLAHDLKHDRPVAIKLLHPVDCATHGTELYQHDILLFS